MSTALKTDLKTRTAPEAAKQRASFQKVLSARGKRRENREKKLVRPGEDRASSHAHGDSCGRETKSKQFQDSAGLAFTKRNSGILAEMHPQADCSTPRVQPWGVQRLSSHTEHHTWLQLSLQVKQLRT